MAMKKIGQVNEQQFAELKKLGYEVAALRGMLDHLTTLWQTYEQQKAKFYQDLYKEYEVPSSHQMIIDGVSGDILVGEPEQPQQEQQSCGQGRIITPR